MEPIPTSQNPSRNGHRKDFSSRRGLLMLVSKRRRLLDYVRRLDPDRYVSLIGKLNLRK